MEIYFSQQRQHRTDGRGPTGWILWRKVWSQDSNVGLVSSCSSGLDHHSYLSTLRSPHTGPGSLWTGLQLLFFKLFPSCSSVQVSTGQYRSVQVRAEIKKSPRIKISLKFRQAERRISVFDGSDDWPGNTGHLLPGSCPLLEVCLHHPSPPLPPPLHHSLAGSRVSTVASESQRDR